MGRVHSITLDSPNVFQGGVVTGHVLLETEPNKKIKARGVHITLVGQEKVDVTRKVNTGETRRTVHYRAEKEFINETVTLLGLPKGTSGDPVFLEAGRQYSFPFKFNLSRECLPSCEYSDAKRIFYRLESCVDRPWKFDLSCETKLRVLPDTHVASASSNYCTRLRQHLAPRVCCCFGKGALKLEIDLVKTAYWWLEEIPVELLVDNSDCDSTITKVKAQLAIVSTYVAKGEVDTHEHELAVEEFPLPNGRIQPNAPAVKFGHKFGKQKYPDNHRFPTATVHGEHIGHKFVVRLTAKYSFGEYSSELPFFVADGPSRPSNPNAPVHNGEAQAVVDDEKPPMDSATPVDEMYDSSQMYNAGQMYDRVQAGTDEAPMFERKEEYGGGRDQYRGNR
ncbi:hypothetical protein BSKO_01883 [Bryopsis sp. KO-2023]|nr:hypothetical protein BSKO_01883 [Bryopsis sp. KO-2023]